MGNKEHRGKEKMGVNDLQFSETGVCPECQCDHLVNDYSRGEMVCACCGLVVTDNHIDQGPDWLAYDAEQLRARARTGPPVSLLFTRSALTTDIGSENRDYAGKSIPMQNRSRVNRLRMWNSRTRYINSNEKNISFALTEIRKHGSKMGLPTPVVEKSALLYKKAAEKNMIRGRSIESMLAAAIYTACRYSDLPRSLSEIAQITQVRKKEIGRLYRLLTKELDIDIDITTPRKYVSKLCSQLELSHSATKKTKEIVDSIIRMELASGRGPLGIVGASIYLAGVLCKEKRTQKEVAAAAGVTEVTIRNRYKEIVEVLDFKLPC